MNEEKTRSAGGKPRRDDPLGTNSEIGRKLREYYDGLMTPEVPDRFTELLSQLETAESRRKNSGEAE
ncbi:NepR family anti-sigma factor [Aquibium microcysteis]|uniref:NepR family anti-sigma factor n=1 Tax=Aquibium microcysteis TaxID=675281 RepID=UPI00165D1753|nr:NepR family anti-sigma factor [Aquibium microcysteis]